MVWSLARGALKIGVRSVSGGIIDGSVLDGAEKDISTLLADQVDIIISDKLKSAKTDRLAIEHFRNYLETFAAKQVDGFPLVFIIDELDRCRPDFALDLLEQIKHLFSVPGIVFLLVLNRSSLEESIKVRYGNNIGATQYLQKFVNLWLTLPRKSDTYQDQGSRYIEYAIRQMLDEGERYQNDYAKQFLEEVSRTNRMSCREIERILSYFALIENMGDARRFYPTYQTILAFVCYLKVTKPTLIEEILKGSIGSDELIKAANLKIQANESDYSHIECLGRLVKFDLGDEETRQAMREEREYTSDEFGRVSTDMLKTVCEWISNISRR